VEVEELFSFPVELEELLGGGLLAGGLFPPLSAGGISTIILTQLELVFITRKNGKVLPPSDQSLEAKNEEPISANIDSELTIFESLTENAFPVSQIQWGLLGYVVNSLFINFQSLNYSLFIPLCIWFGLIIFWNESKNKQLKHIESKNLTNSSINW
jgi:hypothetical protein